MKIANIKVDSNFSITLPKLTLTIFEIKFYMRINLFPYFPLGKQSINGKCYSPFVIVYLSWIIISIFYVHRQSNKTNLYLKSSKEIYLHISYVKIENA